MKTNSSDNSQAVGGSNSTSVTRKSDREARYKFISDTLWFTLPTIFFRLRSLIVLPLFSRYLGAADYGLYVQTSVVGMFIAPVLTLRLETACVRFLAAEKDKSRASESFFSGLALILLLVSLLVALAFLMKPVAALVIWGDNNVTEVVFVTSLNIGLAAINTYVRNYFRVIRAIRTLSILKTIQGVVEIATVLAPVWLGYGVMGALTGSAITRICFLLVYLAIVVRGYGWPHRIAVDTLKAYLEYSLPLVPNGLLQWLNNSSSRYFVTIIAGLSAAGIYSASIGITKPIVLLFNPVTFVLFPMVSKLWDEGNKKEAARYFEYSTRSVLLIAIPAAAGLTYLSQKLLTVLATSEFLVGSLLVLIVATGVIIQKVWLINAYVFHIANKTQLLPLNIGLGAALNVGFCLLLIPRWGIYGAAWANTLSSVINTAVLLLLARRILVYKLDVWLIVKSILASGLMVLVISLLPLDNILQIALACLVGGLVYFGGMFALRGITTREISFAKGLIASRWVKVTST